MLSLLFLVCVEMESMFTGGCSAYQVIVLVQVMPYFNQFIPSANVMLDLTSQIFALTATRAHSVGQTPLSPVLTALPGNSVEMQRCRARSARKENIQGTLVHR